MIYQDTWKDGELVQKGKRECASRYEVVRKFCEENFHEPFSVLDIGANMCYFGIRLIEDFGCNVLAFEFHQFEKRKAAIGDVPGLSFIKKKLKFDEILELPRFDLILALSVLHHVQEPIGMWISRLTLRCKHLIIEHAESDSTRPAVRTNYTLPDGGKIIGYGDSHLQENFKRKIIVYAGRNDQQAL